MDILQDVNSEKAFLNSDTTQDANENIASPQVTPRTIPNVPDGGWGWVVVLAGFLIHVVVDGLMYASGLFYVEFLEDFGSSKGETSVVASLNVGMMFSTGPIAGAFVNLFGCRVTAMVGAVITWLGFIISSLAPNIYVLYFSYGILSGLGFGLMITPAILVVCQYFDKKRSLTLGMTVCGTGVGMFIFPPIIRVLVDEYTWRGAILILAAVMLNLSVCGAVFISLEGIVTATSFEDRAEGIANVEVLDVSQPKNTNSKVPSASRTTVVVAMLKQLKSKFNDATKFRLLKDIPFLLLAFSGTLTSIGSNAPYIFTPHHAKLHGVDEQRISFLISIAGIANTLGRLSFGFFGDRIPRVRLYLFAAGTIFTGLSTTTVPWCKTFPLLATYMAAYGFTYGGMITLNWVLVRDLVSEVDNASALGLCMLFDGISQFVGPPFLGWVFDITGNYNYSFIIGGVMIVISGLILFPIPCIRRKKFTVNLGSKIYELPIDSNHDATECRFGQIPLMALEESSKSVSERGFGY